ncbi:MAG: TMEM175 family protein [Bacteroidetes bacterium]|nr:TMEM175 family protein [Bacteroidota bacterium]
MADKETSRVEAFSDGIFAIAITLLILQIAVPRIVNFLSNDMLLLELIRLWPSYFALILSFFAILIMWINHHGFFRYLKTINSKFLFANGFLLLMVTFIPFPTAVLARYFDTSARNTASAFYCGTMVMISIAYNLLWFTAAFKRSLIKDEISDKLIIKIRNAYWLGFIVYLASFIISFFHAFAGLAICISFWIYWIVLDYTQAERKKR